MLLQASFDGQTAEYRQSSFVRVKDSIELYGVDRQTYNEKQLGSFKPSIDSVPDVWRYNPANGAGKPDFVSMTEDIQHWIFRVNVERYMGTRFATDTDYREWWSKLVKTGAKKSVFIEWWNQLFAGDRSHTNRAGVDTCRNYITGENMTADFPKFSNVVTGRFVGKLADGSPRNVSGALCRPLHCISAKEDYKQYHPFTHPHLFDQPIVTGRTLVQDKSGWVNQGYWWRVFYHFGKKVVLPFILPADTVAWYPADRLINGGIPLRKV